MDCQSEIASKIIERKADYVLAVKENQVQLYENIEDEFRFSNEIETSQDVNFGPEELKLANAVCYATFSS